MAIEESDQTYVDSHGGTAAGNALRGAVLCLSLSAGGSRRTTLVTYALDDDGLVIVTKSKSNQDPCTPLPLRRAVSDTK